MHEQDVNKYVQGSGPSGILMFVDVGKVCYKNVKQIVELIHLLKTVNLC